MRVVEEQTSALVRDLEALGVDGQSLDRFHSKTSGMPASHPAISPVQARVAFVGENTLWRNCETLVNRMCRLESVVQTLKLNIFRLQTEKELNPKHAAQLEQRLNAVHEEHLQEMKIVQQEAMKLRQHLSDMKEAEERAKEEVQRLSTALEITTASKMGVVIAAEELRNTKQKINCRLQELTEQLSQEISLRESLEESQATVMCHIQDMETTVEAERKQVQILQQDCQELRKDVQLARVRLQEEEERTAQLEQQCTQLKAELDSRNCIISQLGEEAKNAQLSFSKQHKENLQLQSKMTALRETAEKVQVLNDHLSQQCLELTTALQNVAMENAKLISDHQTILKAEQEKTRKLQEQDSLLNAAHANFLGELQSVQHERAQLQRELEALRTEHGKYRQKASLAEETATTQRQLLECTVARLQGELETALQEKGYLLAEKEDLEQEVEMVSMKFTLQTLEEKNKRLLDHLATLVHEQVNSNKYAQQQVQQVLAELTDSKNKLICDKGKLQAEVQKLEEELSAAGSREETVKSDLRDCAHCSTLHRVHLEQNERSRNSASECGDSPRVSQRILLSAIKNMGEKLENIIDILTPRRSLKTGWSTETNEGDTNMANLQHQLDAAKGDNNKATSMLENVLASHNKMQAALDAIQTELGHKDTEISNVRKEKTQTQQKIQRLETELENCQAKLVAMGRQHSSQVELLCKALETARADNNKLVCHLEEVLQVNNNLQNKLIQTQWELKSKETEHQQLMVCREQLMEKVKTEEKMYAERLKSLKKQFQTEQEASRKAACQESVEVKKSLEESSSKLAEVSHANRELQQKVTELKKSLPSYTEKLKSEKAQVRQCLACKANTERVKETESELRKMEAIKEEYQKKNYEQSQDILKLVSALKSVQSEMEVLKNQHEVQVQNRQLETQLEAERRQRQQLENECQKLEKTVKYLKKYKEETEKKLKEASIESEQITTSLEEAQRWFKSKFDSLKVEVVKNHQPKNPEELQKGDKESKHIHFKGGSKENMWEKYLVTHYQSEFQFPKLSFVVPYTGVENRRLF
ncbi:PREDICTED: coiled-coil domain-containing protein 150 [Charadrius vociferus]|uniref:coiled-coil domain-containing protein 150 n=1 Tax=Charadrius vociferus TaxID=50402 RepID=UPI0005212618|nr:PREDICTED: coiled-coil domain-containing protein 150 [Charadrius vociferus]